MKEKLRFKNRIFAFCEGDTEEMYLECLSSALKIETHPHKIGGVNINNIDRQISAIWNHLKIKYKINRIDIKQYQIKIYYLVDIDIIKTKKEIDLVKQRFEQEGIQILFSNKNIELFILEHYEYYDKESWNYVKEIKKHKLDYKKGKDLKIKRIFEEIINNYLDAMIKNLNKLKKFHSSNGRIHIYDMNPYSEVIDLIEYILLIGEESYTK